MASVPEWPTECTLEGADCMTGQNQTRLNGELGFENRLKACKNKRRLGNKMEEEEAHVEDKPR